jgi:hypothetical protein
MEISIPILVESAGLWLDSSMLHRFKGVRVIPDVHGRLEPFIERLEEAEAERLFVIQLGDLIDRGPDSPLCFEAMLDVEERKLGVFTTGNHEYAFLRFLHHGISPAVTRQETLLRFEQHGAGLLDKFRERVPRGPLWIRSRNHIFVHAAFHPRMLMKPPVEEVDLDLLTRALLGQRDTGLVGKRRTHGWVDHVPPEITVVVGHEVIDEGHMTVRKGRSGGTVIFADSGSWRSDDASLSCVDILLDDI